MAQAQSPLNIEQERAGAEQKKQVPASKMNIL